jgi:hypothetical protein
MCISKTICQPGCDRELKSDVHCRSLQEGIRLVSLRLIAILFPVFLLHPVEAQPPQLTADQIRVLDGVRTQALQYTETLPDFICVQITHRDITKQANFGMPFNGASSSQGPRGPASSVHSPADSSDLIEERLTFFNQMEHYEVVSVNGRKVAGKEHMMFAGAISAGEFGSALRNIFDPRSHATFQWERTAKFTGQSVVVFRYHVPGENGAIAIDRDTDQKILAAYSGRLFVNPETMQVLRITSELELPIDFPIQTATTTIDYKSVTIAEKTYTLPSRSEVRLKDNSRLYVNQIEFRNYQKFAVESTIHYDSDGSSKNQ